MARKRLAAPLSAQAAAPPPRVPILDAFAQLGVAFRLADEGALRTVGAQWDALRTIPDPTLPGVVVRRSALALQASARVPAESDRLSGARSAVVRVLFAALRVTVESPPVALDADAQRVASTALAVIPVRGAMPDAVLNAFVATVPRCALSRLAAVTLHATLLADTRGTIADLDTLCGEGLGLAASMWARTPGGPARLAQRLWDDVGGDVRTLLDDALCALASATRSAFRGAVVADADATP